MNGEPYSQKSGWIIHSNERIFQVMTFKFSIHSVVVLVMTNIAECLIGDWEYITVVDPEGICTPSPISNILRK